MCRLVPGTRVQCVNVCLVAGVVHRLGVSKSVLGRLLASILGTPIGVLSRLYGLTTCLDGSVTSLRPYDSRLTRRAPAGFGGNLYGPVPNVLCGTRHLGFLVEVRAALLNSTSAAKYAKQLMVSVAAAVVIIMTNVATAVAIFMWGLLQAAGSVPDTQLRLYVNTASPAALPP